MLNIQKYEISINDAKCLTWNRAHKTNSTSLSETTKNGSEMSNDRPGHGIHMWWQA